MSQLSTLAASPAPIAASQRPSSSEEMPPPPVPSTAATAGSSPSLNVLPSNQNAVNNINNTVTTTLPAPDLPSPRFLSMATSPPTAYGDDSGVGPGPGPMRHPRPLTAADLHLQLEKEQEAVVNRLSREISLLRASQNASVVSNASSTSASASASASGAESSYLNDVQQHFASGPGVSYPTQSGRHHRTSSNASQRSLVANAGSVSTTSLISGGISSPAPIRPGQPQHAFGGVSLSRQNSAASRRSRAGSPSPASAQQQLGQTPGSFTSSYSHLNDAAGVAGYFAQARAPQSSQPHHQPHQPYHQHSQSGSVGAAELSPGMMPATSRYEETAFYRGELESVKRENDALRRRVRELERQVRDRRASDISSRPSQSNLAGAAAASAAASSGVGESAAPSASTTPSVLAGVGGAGGANASGQREGAAPAQGARERPRVVSMLSTASVNVGVSEEEVKVGESAASAGLGRDGQGLGQR